MNVKKIIIFAVFAGLTCTRASAYPAICGHNWIEYLTFKVQNHTSEDMLLDMGDPKYGVIEGNKRYFTVLSKESVTAIGCNNTIFAGLETYVRLYGRQHRYMFDWYIDMPIYSTDNSIGFSLYAPQHTCDVTWAYPGHAYRKMLKYQTFPGDHTYIQVNCRD